MTREELINSVAQRNAALIAQSRAEEREKAARYREMMTANHERHNADRAALAAAACSMRRNRKITRLFAKERDLGNAQKQYEYLRKCAALRNEGWLETIYNTVSYYSRKSLRLTRETEKSRAEFWEYAEKALTAKIERIEKKRGEIAAEVERTAGEIAAANVA